MALPVEPLGPVNSARAAAPPVGAARAARRTRARGITEQAVGVITLSQPAEATECPYTHTSGGGGKVRSYL